MATNQQMREGEAELARIVRAASQEVGEAMSLQTGFCSHCRGVLEKRGSRYRCRSCRAVFAENPSAPQPAPQGPPQGHTTTKSRRTRDRHTKPHPSRTGQKKRLDFRRTDKKKKRQKEGEAELARIAQWVGRVAAEAEWETGEAMARRIRVLPGQLALPGIPGGSPHPPSNRRTGGPPRRPGPAIMAPRESRAPEPPPVDPRQLSLNLPDEEMADLLFEGFY